MFLLVKSLFNRLIGYAGAEKQDFLHLTGNISMQLNDPTTPDLRVQVSLPSMSKYLGFAVAGFTGDLTPGTASAQAANCYYTLAKSIEFTQSSIGKFKEPLKKWSAVDKLAIFPRAGKDFNAYYDRQALRFFYEKDPSTSRTIYTADSMDIVAHELGHGLLDTMRPDFWNVQALEIWAFHESFGDINAMITLMHFDKVIEKALAETNGDLRKSNTISRLAEELGSAIYHLTGGRDGSKPDALRNAVNDFTYVKPETLPEIAPNDQLAGEPHSFSRVFTGTWYDMFVRIYEKNVSSGINPVDSVKNARDVSGLYILQAISQCPRTARLMDALARNMLLIDKNSGGVHQEILHDVFKARKILSPSNKLMGNELTLEQMKSTMGGTDEIVHSRGLTAVIKRDAQTIKLSEGMRSLNAISANGFDLNTLELEIPTDSYYEFNDAGKMVYSLVAQEDEAIEAAKACANVIYITEDIGADNKTSWDAIDGKLIRSSIGGCFGFHSAG